MTQSSKTQILIIGGGFGGVKAAQELGQHKNVSVTLLSDHPEFRYYPALYHTATGGARKQSHIPLSELLAKSNVQIVQGTAKTIDRAAKTVVIEDGRALSYDKVIFSLGTVTNYFGIPGVEEYSYGIKSWEQISRFKKHLHEQLQDGKDTELTYVVIGAGPTGIEVAGRLPEYIRKTMAKHGVAGRPFKVQVVEALPRLLPHSVPKISASVGKRLKKLGVELLLDQKVESQTIDSLTINGQKIAADTVVWTAGMSNNPFFKDNNFVIGDHGKVTVDQYMQAEPDVYVIGDNANTPFSGLAQTALYDAEYVAEDIMRRTAGHESVTYVAKKPIPVIPVGDYWSTVEWGKVAFAGFIGGLIREAADVIGFHDVEPWPKAIKQWLTEFDHDEDCPICNKAS